MAGCLAGLAIAVLVWSACWHTHAGQAGRSGKIEVRQTWGLVTHAFYNNSRGAQVRHKTTHLFTMISPSDPYPTSINPLPPPDPKSRGSRALLRNKFDKFKLWCFTATFCPAIFGSGSRIHWERKSPPSWFQVAKAASKLLAPSWRLKCAVTDSLHTAAAI